MAFATTNVRKGTAGDLKITAGQWTGAQADASGSMGVEGSQIYIAVFSTNDTTSPGQMVPWSWTTSGAVSTLLVHNRETVTAGTFIIIHA
jgi:hypothetical protein